MATERRLPASALGRWSVVGAVLTVQLLAFVAAQAAGRPTLYAAFALASAAAVAWAADAGPAGVAAAALGTVLLLALGLPLLLFVARQDPGLVAAQAVDPAVHRMLVLSVYGPLLATLLALATGVPLAYLLARGFPGRALVESLVDLPLVVPHAVAGLVVLFGFGTGGALPWLRVLGTLPGMVLALTFVSAPFAVDGARTAFELVDRRLEQAARVHGAPPLSAFLRVSLPLAARGVLTGGVLAWARAVSEFGAVAVVAYTVEFAVPGGVVQSQHAPVFVYTAYLSEGLAEAGAVAVILLGVSAAVFLAIRWLAGGRGVLP